MTDFNPANRFSFFLLMSCALSTYPVSGEFYDNNSDGQVESWPSPKFTFYSGDLIGSDDLWKEAFQEAAARWNDTATGFVITVVAESATGQCTSELTNTASFRDDVCGDEFGAGVLAVARNVYIPVLNEFVKSEIFFNRAQPFNVYDGDQKPFASDFRRVAIHELGHSMGLDHSAATDSIMYAFSNNTFIPKLEEVNFLRAVYGTSSYELTINIEGQGRVAIFPKVLGTGVVDNNIFYTSDYSNFLDCNQGPCITTIQEGLRLSLEAIPKSGESFISWDGTLTQSAELSLKALNTRRTLTARFTASPITDTDNDGVDNSADADDDNDGVLDVNDAFPLDRLESVDTDRDGVGNNADNDDDNDNALDVNDAFPLDVSESVDTDSDGVGNNADNDDDNDNALDESDAFPLDASVQDFSSGTPIWLLKKAKDLQVEQQSK